MAGNSNDENVQQLIKTPVTNKRSAGSEQESDGTKSRESVRSDNVSDGSGRNLSRMSAELKGPEGPTMSVESSRVSAKVKRSEYH